MNLDPFPVFIQLIAFIVDLDKLNTILIRKIGISYTDTRLCTQCHHLKDTYITFGGPQGRHVTAQVGSELASRRPGCLNKCFGSCKG
jgi:hypothetical protein